MLIDTEKPLKHLNGLAAQHAETELLKAYEQEIRAGRISAAKGEALFRQDLLDLAEPTL